MNRMKAWIRAFFGFSRTETHAFLILLPLMGILIFWRPVYQYWFTHQPQDFSKESKKLDSLLAAMKWDEKDSSITITKSINLFSFNPNTISHDNLVSTGLDSFIAKRMINYRNKGGKFYSIKDLKKTYGMDSSWLKKVQGYLIFPDHAKPKSDFKSTTTVTTRPSLAAKFDLNTADTAQLKTIYGIGSKLSARIIAYRNKLGGFISEGQLSEVYGLDSTVVKEVKKKFSILPEFLPAQINLNTVDEKELAKHPYIKAKLAQAIIAFRHQHGPFQRVEDLKQITIVKEEVFEKIKPYLSTKP